MCKQYGVLGYWHTRARVFRAWLNLGPTYLFLSFP